MITYRNLRSTDFYEVNAVIKDWWGGRDLTGLLPKLFFDHFTNTSLVAEEEGRIVSFLVGFLSQSNPDEAYIHFVGVHPDYRKRGLATELYQRFFDEVKVRQRHVVRCITSPINQDSILFHKRIGFEIVPGDNKVNDVSIHTNYGGEGKDRVLFIKRLPRGKEIW